LVGRAVIRAARLEKSQDWFGIILDPEILTDERRQILSDPIVKPLVVDYQVPFKEAAELRNPCKVINWRLNMVVQRGTGSLFRESSDPSHQKKRNHTLRFCRWLRNNGLASFSFQSAEGKEIAVSWLRGIWVGDKPPGTPGVGHGDDF